MKILSTWITIKETSGKGTPGFDYVVVYCEYIFFSVRELKDLKTTCFKNNTDNIFFEEQFYSPYSDNFQPFLSLCFKNIPIFPVVVFIVVYDVTKKWNRTQISLLFNGLDAIFNCFLNCCFILNWIFTNLQIIPLNFSSTSF